MHERDEIVIDHGTFANLSSPIRLGGGEQYLTLLATQLTETPTYTMCDYKQVVSGQKCENLPKNRFSMSAFGSNSFECGTLTTSDIDSQQKLQWICQ